MKLQWFYKDEAYNPVDTPEYHGFIYQLTYEEEDGQEYTYLGRKNLWSHKTQKAKLNGTERDNHYRFFNKNVGGKRVKHEETRNTSNWRTYNGSCKYVPEGLILVSKDIIRFCDNPIDTTYWETFYLMANEVLFDDKNLNMSVGGKFYAEQVSGSKKYLKGKK